MDFRLKIEPAIMPEDRHRVEDVLKEAGFNAHGGGTDTDMSACDVTFSKKEPYNYKINGRE